MGIQKIQSDHSWFKRNDGFHISRKSPARTPEKSLTVTLKKHSGRNFKR